MTPFLKSEVGVCFRPPNSVGWSLQSSLVLVMRENDLGIHHSPLDLW